MSFASTMIVVGLSHKTAPIEVRERLAMDASVLSHSYRELRAQAGISELVLLSTCNRMEAYALIKDGSGEEAIHDFLGRIDKRYAARIKKALYRRQGEDAVSHLLKVAASLDSMVMGESQILGQVKAAYQGGIEAGTVGKSFHGLFHRVFSAAKEVRSDTEIGRYAASVPSVAVNLAEQVFGNLKDRRALLLGAGKMAELCAEHLKSAGVKELVVANRTASKAKTLAKKFGAQAAGLDHLEDLLLEADVVISSVGGKQPLLTLPIVAASEKRRKGEPQLLIDISVPRSIEAAVNELEMIYTYNLDNLQQLAERAQDKRLEASREAEHRLARWRDEIMNWFGSGQVTPTISRLNEHMELLRVEEIAKARKGLKHLSETDFEKVDYLSRALIKKILHGPLRKLRETHAKKDHVARNVEALEELFDLNEEEKS